jgi:enoyl-CoA hydratase
MSVSDAVSVEFDGSVAIVTLERADRRNVLDVELVEAIVATFDAIEADEDVFAAVVTGRGPAFCAGADLSVLEGGEIASVPRIYEGFLRVARSSLPTVAAINGPAVGAGMNLALSCDVRIVSTEARLISRFPTLGLHPGGGHGWMLTQGGGPQLAAAMLLFGLELRGREIVEAGLALQVAEPRDLVKAATAFAAGAANVPRPLLSRLAETLRANRSLGNHEAAIALELEAQTWSMQQEFFREAVRRFRKR